MSAARDYIEAIQGRAAEARFSHADDQRVAAVDIANDLDLAGLPSERAVRTAGADRRERSGLYPAGDDRIIIPGSIRAAAPHVEEKPQGLSPAERRESIDNRFYPPADERRELGEECVTFVMKMRVFNEEQEWRRERTIARSLKEIREASPGIDPLQARRDAKAHFHRTAETKYALEMRDEALRLFDKAREQDEIAAKMRRLVERPHGFEMDEIPHLFLAIARPPPLGQEPVSEYLGTNFPAPADLGGQLDSFMREGIDLVAEMDEPVQPEKTTDGWKLEGGDAPDEWWDQADDFAKRIRELLIERHPALLTDYRDGYNAHVRKERKDDQEESDPAKDKRSTAEKMLGLANFERSGPRRVVEACLEGLRRPRHRIGASPSPKSI